MIQGLVKQSLKHDSAGFMGLMNNALIAEKYLRNHKFDTDKFTLLLSQ